MAESAQGLPRSTVAVSAVAILFAGLGTFVLMQWTGSRTRAGELRAAIEQATARETELRSQADPLAEQYERLKGRTDLLWTGKLKVCNSTDDEVVVSPLAAVYLAEDGSFVTFNSSDHGSDLWRLAPGEVRELSFPDAGWDGSVSYYSLWIKGSHGEVPYAGAWPVEAGFCVRHTVGGQS
jgi:hypothetical protein